MQPLDPEDRAPPEPPPSRFVRVDDARRRFGDRVDRLAPWLWRVDPLADAAVAALASLDRRQREAVVTRALSSQERSPGRRSEPVPGLPEVERLIESCAVVPWWVDWARVDRGGRLLLRSGILGGIVLGAKALIGGYAAPGGNKPLVLSGQLAERAAARLSETSRFVQAVSRPGGMRPGRDGWAITVRVRLMHAEVRRMVHSSGRWRPREWGAPINQHDMVATILLFSAVTMDGLRQLGLRIDSDEADDAVHLWRWVGHVIGVEPELLPATEREAQGLCALIAATQGPPDEDSRLLTDALMRAGERDAERRGDAALLARARRIRPVAYGVCRALLGDELATGLGIPASRWQRVVPVVRRAVAASEELRRRSARLEEQAVAQGVRYWDRVVARGAVEAMNGFELPTELLGLSRVAAAAGGDHG
jgi:hypothetical protein